MRKREAEREEEIERSGEDADTDEVQFIRLTQSPQSRYVHSGTGGVISLMIRCAQRNRICFTRTHAQCSPSPPPRTICEFTTGRRRHRLTMSQSPASAVVELTQPTQCRALCRRDSDSEGRARAREKPGHWAAVDTVWSDSGQPLCPPQPFSTEWANVLFARILCSPSARPIASAWPVATAGHTCPPHEGLRTAATIGHSSSSSARASTPPLSLCHLFFAHPCVAFSSLAFFMSVRKYTPTQRHPALSFRPTNERARVV